jgi:hypothetical protein
MSNIILCTLKTLKYENHIEYIMYICYFILYSRACGFYQDLFDGGLLLTRKLLNQGFLLVKFKASPRKSYGRHHDRYGILVSQMTTDMFRLS